jgi:hypothetical protein
MKNSYGRGAGTIPTGCDSGKENDAGLCYNKCTAGYNGVGPVCWGNPPANWVQCGMGAAKNSTTCASIVFGQVSSVGQLALTVATLGSSSAVESGANAGANASKLAQLKAKFEELKKAYEAAKKSSQALQAAEDSAKAGGKLMTLVSATDTASNVITEEDIARASAQIASLVDSSGVSATIGAYTYPKCSKYFGPQSVVPAGSTPVSNTPTNGTPANNGSTATPSASPGAGLAWVRGNGGAIPVNAVIGGQEPGRNLPVCHGSYQNGVHPGKVVAGKCNIGWGGHEIQLTNFEILTNNSAKLRWVNGPSAAGMVIGGQEPGRSLPICRGSYQNGVHPGKVVAGKCNIGWGGKEITLQTFEVLVQ